MHFTQEVHSVLIRLSQILAGWHGPGFGSVRASALVGAVTSPQLKQRAKGVEGIETAVEAEGELVVIGFQVLRADAVMDATQPSLEGLEKPEVNDQQENWATCMSAVPR